MSKIIIDEKIIDSVLSRGVENIYPDRDSLKKLLTSGKEITLYCGYDPTGVTLHIGHGITIRKLSQFQQLGHKVIFLFGDFTAQIGDPDKLSVRQPLTHDQVMENLKGWKKQIENIIDINKVEFKFNSKWLANLSFTDLIDIAKHFTVQQMMDRDMFKERVKQERPIWLHEFFYPLMQAYDSVAMDVDLEIGGNDQTFNMLAGRTLSRAISGKEKLVLTTKLLADPTGNKMGKTTGNMITLTDSSSEMYGKVMSWTDEMILSGMEILTDISDEEINSAKTAMASGANPRDFKMKLAYEVVKVYQGEKSAQEAEESFKKVFQEGGKPTEITEVTISQDKLTDGEIGVLNLFVAAGLGSSNGEIRRLIQEGGILINDEKVSDESVKVSIPAEGLLLQRGKKMFARVFVK